MLPGVSLLVHGLCFCRAGGVDNVGFGHALGAGRRRFAFADGLLGRRVAAGFRLALGLLSLGQCFDAVALSIGWCVDRGNQLLLPTRDFLVLKLDPLLTLDNFNLHFFRLDSLGGLVLLQVVGQVGFGFLQIHRGHVFRLVRFVIALRFGDPGIGLVFCLFAGLLRLRRLDIGVALGFRLSDDRVTLDLGDARPA